MSIENLFKRYLKEIGAYGSSYGKLSIEFLREFSEAYYPFNSFRWDTSEQGHSYWYERAVNWLIYLYNNYDEEEYKGFDAAMSKEKIANMISDMFVYYTPNAPTESITIDKFAFYKEAKKILEECAMKVDEYQ